MPERWWDNLPNERYWLEATDRPDIGANLKAPLQAETRSADWRYTLFKEARIGDIVFHYDKKRTATGIVGSSQISGPWYEAPIVWGARGTAARERFEVPHEQPGYVVPLADFTPFNPTLSLNEIRAQVPQLKELRRRLEKNHPGMGLYFPFELSDKRPPRLLQGYAFKFPSGLLDIFPRLRQGMDPMLFQEGIESQGEPASNRRARTQGQGYGSSPEVNKAIELHAMQSATAYFEERGYAVIDTSSNNPFDLEITKANERYTVEVKGTSSDGTKVLLTRNEVSHTKTSHGRCILYVLSGVDIQKSSPPIATGGNERVWWPWEIEDGALQATQYEYAVPPEKMGT